MPKRPSGKRVTNRIHIKNQEVTKLARQLKSKKVAKKLKTGPAIVLRSVEKKRSSAKKAKKT